MNRLRMTGWWSWIAGLGVLVAGITLLALLDGKGGAEPSKDDADRTIQGTVDRFTTAPKGEVDGAVLDDGTLIHWPPHVGAKIAELVGKKDKVEVKGHQHTGPRGDSHFEVQTITNVRSGASLNVKDIPPPKGPHDAETKTVQGTVERLTTAPKGEVDGAVLDDGTVVHWPPHLESRFKSIVAKGDRIKATGQLHTGHEGEKHLEVQSLTNLRSDETRTREDDAPPPHADRKEDREQRLKMLEAELERIKKEIDRLEREK